MLHMPSYNMGMTAGLAWKAAGNEYLPPAEIKEGTPFGDMILQLLDLTENHMFLPSSYFEGFYNAYYNPILIDSGPVGVGRKE